MVRQLPQRGVPVPHAGHVMELAALGPLGRGPAQHLAQGQQERMGLRADVLRQVPVHIFGPPREAVGTPVVQDAVRTPAGEGELVHNDQRIGVGVQLSDERCDRAPDFVSGSRQLVAGRRSSGGREEVLEI